jgi:hypothetical protein
MVCHESPSSGSTGDTGGGRGKAKERTWELGIRALEGENIGEGEHISHIALILRFTGFRACCI